MIFNRTQNDVNTAIELKKRLQNGEELSVAEVEQLERGTLTINTLNRIESKCAELVSLLRGVGYYVAEIPLVVWSYEDYFKQADFDRIIANIDVLRNAFYVYSYTPKTPENNYRKLQPINDVEKILYDLEAMTEDIKSHYRQCGTFQCGEVNNQ